MAQSVLGVTITGGPARFGEPTWTYEGGTKVVCCDCDGELHVFRRPYDSNGRQYRYWGFACPGCCGAFALDEFDTATQKRLKGEDQNSPRPAPAPKPLFTPIELADWAASRACGDCRAQIAAGRSASVQHTACLKAMEAARLLKSLSSSRDE